MEGIKFKISGSFIGAFDEIAEQMPTIEKKALYRAAIFLRDKVRESIISNVPKSTVRNPKYADTLADAARFTKVDGGSLYVHALGSRASNSGTYRTRFFENQTKERYQKTFNGKKLKKKRHLGHVGPTHFFSSAIDANKQTAVSLMEDTLSRYVNIAFKNTK